MRTISEDLQSTCDDLRALGAVERLQELGDSLQDTAPDSALYAWQAACACKARLVGEIACALNYEAELERYEVV